jgi:phospholipid/cholesterol/gamma-HCH transport system substrate-binding protein
MESEKKVGVTILAGIVCLAVLVLFISRSHLGLGGYRVHFMFRFVDSLKEDAPVLFGGGVRMGLVEKIEQQGSLVKVTCRILGGHQVARDAEVTIRTTGILGEKYVQVDSGDPTKGVLAADETLDGEDPGSLDRTLQRLEKLSDYLVPLLQDKNITNHLANILEHADQFTSDLSDMTASSKQDVKEAVANFHELSVRLKELTDDKNRKAVEASLQNLQQTLEKLNRVLSQVESKKGTLGAVVYDDEMAENLRQLLRDLKNHPWKLLWKK